MLCYIRYICVAMIHGMLYMLNMLCNVTLHYTRHFVICAAWLQMFCDVYMRGPRAVREKVGR